MATREVWELALPQKILGFQTLCSLVHDDIFLTILCHTYSYSPENYYLSITSYGYRAKSKEFISDTIHLHMCIKNKAMQ